MKNRLVFLTGFMASGKSTIGPILANTLGWNFIDIDKMIEAKCCKSVREIFDQEGEKYFRTQEREILEQIKDYDQHIISLGGGTIADQNNLDLMKSAGLIIYLESSPEEAYKRLRFKRDRPVLSFEGEEEPTKAQYLKRINDLLNSRKKYYDQAHIKVNTDNMRVGRTVDLLVRIIKKEMNLEKNKS